MSHPKYTPPAADELLDLRQRPHLQHPAQQRLIDRFASGEISSEELNYQLIREVQQRTSETQQQRQQDIADGLQDMAQEAQWAEEARQMERNHLRDEPEIFLAEAPAAVLPAASPLLPGSGGASGSWLPAVATSDASTTPTTWAQDSRDYEGYAATASEPADYIGED